MAEKKVMAVKAMQVDLAVRDKQLAKVSAELQLAKVSVKELFAERRMMVDTVLAQREKVARTIASWRTPGLKRVMEAWTEYLEIMHGERAKEAQELAKHIMQGEREQEAQELANLKEATTRQMMRKVLSIMRQQRLASAMDSWRCNACSQKAEARKCKREIARLAYRIVFRCLDSWQNQVGKECRRREAMSLIIFRISRLVLSTSFEFWREHLTAKHAAARLLGAKWQQGMAVCLNRNNATLHKEFTRWEESAKKVRRQLRLMQRVVMRMKSTRTSLARWRENIQEKKAMETTSTRAVMRWMKQAVVRCLGVWSQWTTEEVQKRQVMKKIVRRTLHRSVSFAVDLWQQKVHVLQQKQAEEKRRQSIMSRVVKRMVNQAQAEAVDRWSANVCELVRQRGIMEGILRRMLNAKMSAGMFCIFAHASLCV